MASIQASLEQTEYPSIADGWLWRPSQDRSSPLQRVLCIEYSSDVESSSLLSQFCRRKNGHQAKSCWVNHAHTYLSMRQMLMVLLRIVAAVYTHSETSVVTASKTLYVGPYSLLSHTNQPDFLIYPKPPVVTTTSRMSLVPPSKAFSGF